MPVGSIKLPPALLAALGEAPEAVKAARAELAELEKEIIRAAREGRKLDDAQWTRQRELRGALAEYEKSARRERVNIASLRRDILDVKGLYDSLASGRVNVGTMRDLRDTLSLAATGAQRVGLDRVSGALAGASTAIAGPAGLIAGLAFEQLQTQLAASYRHEREALLPGEGLAAFRRQMLARARTVEERRDAETLAGDVEAEVATRVGARLAEERRLVGLRESKPVERVQAQMEGRDTALARGESVWNPTANLFGIGVHEEDLVHVERDFWGFQRLVTNDRRLANLERSTLRDVLAQRAEARKAPALSPAESRARERERMLDDAADDQRAQRYRTWEGD